MLRRVESKGPSTFLKRNQHRLERQESVSDSVALLSRAGTLRNQELGTLGQDPEMPIVKRRRRTARTRSSQSSANALHAIAPPVWDKEPYAVTDDGPLLVRVVEVQGPEWVRKYQRWSIRLECKGVFEPVSLSLFLNMGGDKSGPGVPGRQSKYYRHWTMGNGGPPKKGQAMNWDVFLDKFFVAEVEKSSTDAKGKEKIEEEIYSRISEFVRREEM
jgi:hypothetical protein